MKNVRDRNINSSIPLGERMTATEYTTLGTPTIWGRAYVTRHCEIPFYQEAVLVLFLLFSTGGGGMKFDVKQYGTPIQFPLARESSSSSSSSWLVGWTKRRRSSQKRHETRK